MVYGIGNVTGNVLIGRNGENGGPINGYISNFRYIVGTSLYTANFTPSTAPLTAITNTQILTCQSNSFIDNSGNSRAISIAAGTPSVQAFSPFVPAYITPTTFSNVFDGTGDFVSTGTAANLDNISGDFTIEYWQYPVTGSNGQYVALGSAVGSYSGNATSFVYVPSTNNFYSVFNTTSGPNYTGGDYLNKWTHVAWVRNGVGSNNCTLYLNGVSVATSTYTGTLNLNSTNSNTFIGKNGWDASYLFTGALSNLRIVKGTAVYTANFTPPTAPLTAIANTQLLTCQSSTFLDNSTNTFALTANGNVQPVTTAPFPAKVDTTTLNSAYSKSLIGGSAYFDGTGDYLNTPTANTSLQFGTGDFTVEFWAYPTNLTGSTGIGSSQIIFASAGASSFMCSIWTGNVHTVKADVADLYDFPSTAVRQGNWFHVAICRASGSMKCFVNGAQAGSTTADATDYSGTGVGAIGANYSGGYNFTGYISGLRVLKGTALYNANFATGLTPPTPITNTSLLTNFTNGAIFDNTAKNVLETAGGAALSSTQAKYGTTSMYFDGTGDWLIAANGKNYINGTEPFTIECWVYITGTPAYWSICGASSGTLVLTIQNLTTININPYGSGNTVSATTSLSINTWTHIAATRNSANRFDIWVNGVSAGNATSSQSFGSPTIYAIGAADSGGTQPFIGYLDDVRITKACRYFGNFTPPTSQLQDQ
jgi:hypothetical protein